MTIQLPQPPPMRERFLARATTDTSDPSKVGPDRTPSGAAGAGGDTGISRAWFIWLKQVFDTIVAQINAITGLTITSATQAQLATLGPTLQPNSLVFVSDFNHLLEWDGTKFDWGPGENGSGYVQGFLETPSAAGWQLCDGSNVDRLNGDGTKTAVTVPDYSTASYLKFAKVADLGPHAAAGVTGATSGGTPSGAVTNGNNDASTVVQAGVGTTVAADPHSHPAAFVGDPLAAHTHTPGTIELQRTTLKAYYRR